MKKFFDVLCDFFARTVVWPGQYAFPAGDTKGERLLAPDEASVLTQLLTTHLSHHGLKVAIRHLVRKSASANTKKSRSARRSTVQNQNRLTLPSSFPDIIDIVAARQNG